MSKKQKNKKKETSKEKQPANTTVVEPVGEPTVEPVVNQEKNVDQITDRPQEKVVKKSTKYPIRWEIAKKGRTKRVTRENIELAADAKEDEPVTTEVDFVQRLRKVLQNEPVNQNEKVEGEKVSITKMPKYPIRWQVAKRKIR